MVAADAERDRPGRNDGRDPGLDPGETVVQVDGIDRQVADVGDVGDAEGLSSGDVVHPPHQARLVADLARSMARAGPVGGAAVPGNAVERDVEPLRRGHKGQPHEGRHAGVARHQGRIDRLVGCGLGFGHRPNSSRTACSIPATASSISQRPFSAEEPLVIDSTPEGGTSSGGIG